MRTLLLLSAFTFALTACKKETEHKEAIPSSNLSGALFLNKSKQTLFTYPSGSYDIYSEYMMGFFQIAGTFDMANAGSIRYGDTTLKNTGGVAYATYIDNPTPSSGFTGTIEGGKVWSVAGNTNSTVPTFTLTAPSAFPSVVATSYASLPTIDRSVGYTVTWDNSVPCDSIQIRIQRGSAGNPVIESGMMAGNISSYTFSASQLSVFQPSTLATTNGSPITNDFLVIQAWIVKRQTVSGTPIHIINAVERSVRIKII